MTILEINEINAGYEKLQVLFDISMEISEDSIVTILGPNGSGKSTLLKTVFGITSIYGGSIKFNRDEISHLAPHEIAKLGISYLPQVENLYLNLSVRENLIVGGYILSEEERERNIKDVLEFFPVLKGLLDEIVYTLSGGEKQMLVMGKSLIRKPALMLLDEPSANLAQKIMGEVFEKIKELRDSGIGIIIVEQNTRKALEIADYAYLLVSGRINYHGNAKELAANKEFGRLFLGL